MLATSVKKIRLLIADDHRVLLDGLVSLLRSEKNFEIAATAGNGTEVIALLGKYEFDICLLDISMPGLDGMEAAKWIKKNKPETKIIILTTHDEEEIIAEMLHIGVSGYLFKTSTRQELVEGINRVMSGKMYFTDEVNKTIMKGYSRQMEKKKFAVDPIVLTPREKEIVRLLAKEFTNEKIAVALSISYRTVETHRKNIMQKTKASNLAGLLKYAYSNGLID
jgi:DNA-binding NarL/FixJ family response regulator